MKIILASASLRRHELMKIITTEFEVVVSNFNEEAVKFNGNPCDYVIELSAGKAKAAYEVVEADSVIIGADTVVALDNKILGKPKSREEAFEMLLSLSGRWHEVYTGITIINRSSGLIDSQCVSTRVKFSTLSHDEISAYLDKSDYRSFAGSYGIQGTAGIFVEQIEGDYYNIVGLPVNRLYNMVKNFL